MAHINESLTRQHRDIDEAFCDFEKEVEQANWSEALNQWQRFSRLTQQHFELEEQHVFTAFEAATGTPTDQGPTGVMLVEHQQIRDLLGNMRDSLDQQDSDALLEFGDTLMVTIQQHNMKEESMLYPMCDQLLDDSVLQEND